MERGSGRTNTRKNGRNLIYTAQNALRKTCGTKLDPVTTTWKSIICAPHAVLGSICLVGYRMEEMNNARSVWSYYGLNPTEQPIWQHSTRFTF